MYAVDSFSIIAAVTYRYEVLSDDDPFAQLVKERGHAVSHCGPIGDTPVDLFPICTPHPDPLSWMFMNHLVVQHPPSWFPGTFFLWKAQEYSQIVQQMQDYPFDGVQRQMVCMVIMTERTDKDRRNSKTFFPLLPPWASASRSQQNSRRVRWH